MTHEEIAIALIAGFGGALAGAVAGFAGTQLQTTRAARARKNGMLVALAGELSQNANRAIIASAGTSAPVPPYSLEVWNNGKFEFANLLSRQLFTLLLEIYSTQWMIELVSPKLRDGKEHVLGTIVAWYETVREVQRLLLAEAKVPGLKGWKPIEPLHVELTRLANRVQQADEINSSVAQEILAASEVAGTSGG